MYLILDN